MATLALTATLLVACAARQSESVLDPDVANIATAFFAEKVRSNLAHRYWESEQPGKWAVGCVSGLEAQEIGSKLGSALRLDMTTEELRQARDFLATPTGRLYMERAVYEVPRAAMSESQAADLKAFSKTGAALTLLNPQSTARYTDAFDLVVAKDLEDCRRRYQNSRVTHSEVPPPVVERNLGEIPCTPPRPVYPSDARMKQQSGKTVVKLWANTKGIVYLTLVTESSGVPSLDKAAENAVQGMRCRPFVDNGKPVRVTAQQPISFELN
ncbi:energy transducer TonB [Cupriavidus sp. CP313]